MRKIIVIQTKRDNLRMWKLSIFYHLRLVSRLKIWTDPLSSLRSKAHKVIWEILPYIRAWFAFKLHGPYANFPTHINCLHTIFSLDEPRWDWFEVSFTTLTCLTCISSVYSFTRGYLGNFGRWLISAWQSLKYTKYIRK